MSAYVAALATVIAVFVMLRAERRDIAKVGDLSRIEARIDTLESKTSARIEALDTKMSARIEALDTKISARLDTVVLELGKAFGRPAS
jgi:phage host-nuclease inhibitor protein Gam